jgi:hypothetical protein
MGRSEAEAQQTVENYFRSRKEMLEYFGTTDLDCVFDVIDEVWDFVGGCQCSPAVCTPDYVIWGQGTTHRTVNRVQCEIPLALTQENCCYCYRVVRVTQTMYHTVVYIPERALIFNNKQRFDIENHYRTLRKMGVEPHEM